MTAIAPRIRRSKLLVLTSALIDALARRRQATNGNERDALLRRLLDSVDGDEALLRDVVSLFRGDASRQVQAIRAALASGDAAAIGRAAHSFRGSAANFGETPLFELLTTLEQHADAGDLAACASGLALVEPAVASLLSVLPTAEEALSCAS